MNRLAIMTAFAFIAGPSAFAAPQPTIIAPNNKPTQVEATTQTSSNNSNVVVVPRSQIAVQENSSAHNRMGKKSQVTAGSGLIIGLIPGAGLNYEYFLTPNSTLQLQAAQGEVDTWFFSDHTFEGTLISANYKRFEGNSFYYRVGGDYRKIKVSSNDKDFGIFASDERISGTAESLSASIAIGNQWQFESFTIGCDWIGLTVPVINISNTFKSDNMASASYASDKKDWEDLKTQPSAQILRLYLGASF